MIVIPVVIEQATLPLETELPADIRDLVLHQKHDIVYESFERDIAALISIIDYARQARHARNRLPWVRPAAGSMAAAVLACSVLIGSLSLQGYSRQAEQTTNGGTSVSPQENTALPARVEVGTIKDAIEPVRAETEARVVEAATVPNQVEPETATGITTAAPSTAPPRAEASARETAGEGKSRRAARLSRELAGLRAKQAVRQGKSATKHATAMKTERSNRPAVPRHQPEQVGTRRDLIVHQTVAIAPRKVDDSTRQTYLGPITGIR